MSKRPEPYSPYCGLVVNDKDQYEKVQGAPHLAISAPTRTGKTRRLLAPAAVLHPGPLVAVSSKEDLAELVLMRRGVTGPTGVIDLRPEKTLVWPAGVRSMVSDPTMSIGSADEALTVAETMLAMANDATSIPATTTLFSARFSSSNQISDRGMKALGVISESTEPRVARRT